MITKRKLVKGSAISGGIALGYARVMTRGVPDIVELVIPATRVRGEIKALEEAVEQTVDELGTLRDTAGKKMGLAVTKIFDAQLMIATDKEFLKHVKQEIAEQKRNARSVYHSLVQATTLPLLGSRDIYMRQMAKDIEAVSSRVLSHLSGYQKSDLRFPPNTILVGDYFSPGEILSYRQRKAVGLLVSEGGRNSHMALIARALMLPVVMVRGIWTSVPNHAKIIIDGTEGTAIIYPDEHDWSEHQKKKKRHGPALITRIKKLTQIPPVTKDGQSVQIAANLSLLGPANEILSAKKIPVGLYRTEYLYLAHDDFPDEDTQYRYYRRIAEQYVGTSVVIRTFDLGYDKLASRNFWPKEDNPALGWRGIRPMLELTQIFKTQIRAILRASTQRNLKIMLPMISETRELLRARKLISQVKFSLRKENIPFDADIETGIMVEVPAAALAADDLARKADFLSIGTNDLTQYTLAADRMNSKVAHIYNSFHPSVLRLIQQTVDAGHRFNKPVSICGEVAGDPLALPLFIGMGVDTLSINPNRIFDMCRLVGKIDSHLVRHLVGSVMSSSTAQEVTKKLEEYSRALGKRRTFTIRK